MTFIRRTFNDRILVSVHFFILNIVIGFLCDIMTPLLFRSRIQLTLYIFP